MAVRPVVPVTVSAPVWLTAPPALTSRFPVTALVPRTSAFASTSDTFLPATETAPVKLLAALAKVTS